MVSITHLKKVSVITNGCPENRIDCARIQEIFKRGGWKVTDDFCDADLIIFNACGLTNYNQEYSIDIVNQIKERKKPSARLIACGCLPKINKNRVQEVWQDIVSESDAIQWLDEILHKDIKSEEIHANYLINSSNFINRNDKSFLSFKNIERLMMTFIELPMRICRTRLSKVINVYNPHTFCIKVSTGCSNKCAYCAVQLSRGHVKSKPIKNIKKEFKEGLKKNYKEFALIGTDVGSYGRDIGTDLVSLLKELIKNKGEYTIKLRNVHPRFLIEMMPELQEVFQSGKISYICSAAQSGNNRVLKLMDRGYKIEDFKEAIRTINKKFPNIKIRTQLMTGFPGETKADFKDTVRLLNELRFDFVEVYNFESRPGTKAEKLEGKVPQKVACRRYHRLCITSFFHMCDSKKYKRKVLS